MKISDKKHPERMLLLKPLLAILVLTALTIGTFLVVYQYWMTSLLERVAIQNRQNLIQIVSIARNAVEPVLIQVRSGKLSRAEALRRIRALVRTMTYTDQYGNNYVFMSTYDGIMLVQPFEPRKEMTNQWNLKDIHGLYIIRELVKAAQTHPSGSFVRYYYHLPGVHGEQEKLAYVVGLPELDCYIGTGMYMQRSIQEQLEILEKVQYGAIGLLIAVLIPISAAIAVILKRNRLLLSEIMTRKKAEEDLQKSEERYRSIFENAVEGIYQTMADGRIINANPAFARTVGYDSPQEMIESGIGIDQYYANPSDRENLLRVLQKKGSVRDYVVRMKRRDGSLAWLSINAHVVKDEQGNVFYYEGTVEDISTRKMAEEELLRLAAIARHSSELVSLSTMDGRMVYLNETGARMLGIDPENLASTSIMQVIPDHQKDLVEQEMLPALAAGAGWEGDLQYVNLKTGDLTDVHALTFTIDDPQAGQHRYLANVSLDISRHKQAEEKFAKIFLMAPDGISITRMRDGLIVDTNIGFQAITGWERSEVLGRTSLEVNFWADPADRALLVEELKAGRDVLQREFQFRRKDGTVRSGIYSARPIQIAGEACLVFVMQDITERKETERMLRENEERLRGITANIPGVVYRFYAKDSGEYGISYASDGMREVFGLSSEGAAMYPTFLAHLYEEDRDRYEASIRSAIEKSASWNFEGRFVKPSGEMIWFQGLSTPTRHADGLVFDGIMLNITERKLAEEQSRQAEDKFVKIFMTTPDCIAITRMQDGRIMDVNRGFEDVLGWRRDEVIGKTALDINVWGDPAERGRMVNDLNAGQDVLYRETLFRRKDGVMRSVIYSARSIQIANELCIIFVMQDMTDRKILEEDRRKLEQQLYQSQKMDAIGQLASGVAHDFNNILTGIQGNASLMRLEYDHEHPHFQRLRQIEEQVLRGANLTRQLLGFARGGKYEVKTIALNDLIRKSTQFFLETRKDIEADLDLQKGIYPVDVDAGQIEQVLLNLYINAGHAMPRGGSLHIQTTNTTFTDATAKAFETQPGEYAMISISDTGVGMDSETLSRIFEPFFTTRTQQGGTGLGLASAYGIIRNHGGAIHAYSEPGKGSTFTLYLPSSLNKVTHAEPATEKGLYTGSGSILLVDDEPMILDIASNLLKKLGYTVYQAVSGPDAIQIYREQHDPIDLVILDMIMPGMNGSQVLTILKDINPDVKVILSSGYGLQGEVQKLMETGCRGFIQKPYVLSDLSAIVHHVLHPTAQPGTEETTVPS